MIKKVDQTSVADIFSINSDRIYRIPKYQREYTWGTRDWDALFKDVTENGTGYFLGSYICVNSGSLNGTTLEVIDGQQRFRALLDDLYVKSQKYALIVNNSDEEHSYTSALLDLDRISGAPSYLLLLYLLSNQEELKLTDDNIHQVVKLLIVFFVRRSVTDVPNTRKLTQLFIDIISEIKILQGDEIISCIRKTFKSVAATDEEFEAKLRGSLYDENPEAVRFILCSIEAEHQTKEIYSDLWSRDRSNKYIWTIEHIFPEGQNIPDSWVDMIANGDKELAKQYLSEYVHTLGNLTITGYNQNLSNMSFDKKKDRKSKDKSKDIGYRNGLFLNQDVVTEDVWTIDKIKNRTNKIVGILIEMYKW